MAEGMKPAERARLYEEAALWTRRIEDLCDALRRMDAGARDPIPVSFPILQVETTMARSSAKALVMAERDRHYLRLQEVEAKLRGAQ